MEGFLRLKIRPVLRRLMTRAIAIIPAVLVIALKGEGGTYGLLILSQVVLSVQLPFAVIPLIQFTSEKERMGEFVNRAWVQILAWTSAAIIVGLNAQLIVGAFTDWMATSGGGVLWILALAAAVCCGVLLLYIAIPRSWITRRRISPAVSSSIDLTPLQYRRIGVALDYGQIDGKVLSHAQTLARQHSAAIFLFHVVEGVSGQLFGEDAFDNEARSDHEQLEAIAQQVRMTGLTVHTSLGFGTVPEQIIKFANETGIDLLVMGGHRHRGWKDIFFGASISEVRHKLSIPVLVVQ
jgi:manganese transport protein